MREFSPLVHMVQEYQPAMPPVSYPIDVKLLDPHPVKFKISQIESSFQTNVNNKALHVVLTLICYGALTIYNQVLHLF
jgi:hypothetical protein